VQWCYKPVLDTVHKYLMRQRHNILDDTEESSEDSRAMHTANEKHA
jgi:hypothetical protein